MAYSNQPTFGFSHQAVLNHVDAIGDPAHRGAVIVQLLEAYRQTEARWSEVLNSHPSGLDKRRTQEYADILGCPPEFESVVSASYNLTQVWPKKTVPLLETDLDVLNIRAESEQLFRVIEWDQLSTLFYFDIRRILREVENIADDGRKIQALEDIRRSVLANGKSGTLIMIDPDTGNEVQPEEEVYGDVLVSALRDYLDPELYKLKTIPYVAGKRSGRESEHNPHYTDQIRWIASTKALVALLEGLLSRDLIGCTLDQLPAIGICHTSDKFEEPLSVDELLPYFSKRPKVEVPEECLAYTDFRRHVYLNDPNAEQGTNAEEETIVQ